MLQSNAESASPQLASCVVLRLLQVHRYIVPLFPHCPASRHPASALSCCCNAVLTPCCCCPPLPAAGAGAAGRCARRALAGGGPGSGRSAEGSRACGGAGGPAGGEFEESACSGRVHGACLTCSLHDACSSNGMRSTHGMGGLPAAPHGGACSSQETCTLPACTAGCGGSAARIGRQGCRSHGPAGETGHCRTDGLSP